ncbi:AraC family transcriptional regulator [Hymenobacter metallicola]|uniref:AraC family transcriptional regulator n=1 Tax=Hymenobacter metallicola TaxID=2563114 RepID=A0A4Z0QB20_9BACT|nr:AraC family transcriptional regulator [Hymenobacter metallicola]TGE26261.1 AraC family transcriptional regulator [Hymenobacter metallicola]
MTKVAFPPSPDSASVALLNVVLWAATHAGADQAELGRRLTLSPALLTDPDARVPISTIQQLWHEAVLATHDPHLALHLGEKINLAALGILAYVLLHCPTLGAALEQLVRYQDVACAGVRLTLRPEAELCWLDSELTSPAIIYPEHVINSEFSTYLSAFRTLTGRPLAPREVHLAYSEPADTQEHERVFAPARLVFGTPISSIGFDMTLLHLPVINANPVLFPLFEQHAAALLARLHTPSLPERVKREIVELLKGAAPTLATVADRLTMGVRTLQLKLKETGHTYQQLLDAVRHDLAQSHLRDAQLSTTDIAFLLGYSEPSAFVRSFKKWTGQTPGAFRKEPVR